MQTILAEIHANLRKSLYKNEEHVRLSIVSRVLMELGWNVWNPTEVYPEFPVAKSEDATRVDLALFAFPGGSPSVFLEIKSPGKLEDNLSQIELQVRNYNRDNTAQIALLTDGQRYRFYLPQAGGEFSQKCFEKVDLLRDDLNDVELSLRKFLGKSEITSGNAKSAAEAYLKLSQKQRAMEDSLPEAKRRVQNPPFPSLPQALRDLIQNRGHKLDLDEAQKFIMQAQERGTPAAIIRDSHTITPSVQVRTNVEDLDRLDPLNPPNLKFTKVVEANFGKLSPKKWSDLARAGVKLGLERGLTAAELARYFPIKEGRHTTDGFQEVQGTGVSLQGMDAQHSWQKSLSLAQRIRTKIIVRFQWRDKLEAAHPGKEGVLFWTP